MKFTKEYGHNLAVASALKMLSMTKLLKYGTNFVTWHHVTSLKGARSAH